MNAELERIRRKVEQGTPLEPSELERLERAAAADTSPTGRLALAQAWINADEERRALDLLERMRHDFPREVQVHLAHARALFALDRFTEAEAAVRRALAVNPGDLEGEKSLAILALRRGELPRARAILADVLRRDPFDEEARLLQAELEGVELPGDGPRPLPPLPEFASALIDALTARGHRSALRGSELLVQVGARFARVDVSSLHAGYLEEGAPAPLSDAASSLAEQLVRGAGALDSASLPRVLPVLRESGFAAQRSGSAHRAGPADLEVLYALEDPDLVRYVPASALPLELSVAQLDSVAFANLGARLVEPTPVAVDAGRLHLSEAPAGLWALAAGDGHDAARVLVPAQRARMSAASRATRWALFFGSRTWTVFCRADDASARARLGTLAVTDGWPGEYVLTLEGTLTRAPG